MCLEYMCGTYVVRAMSWVYVWHLCRECHYVSWAYVVSDMTWRYVWHHMSWVICLEDMSGSICRGVMSWAYVWQLCRELSAYVLQVCRAAVSHVSWIYISWTYVWLMCREVMCWDCILKLCREFLSCMSWPYVLVIWLADMSCISFDMSRHESNLPYVLYLCRESVSLCVGVMSWKHSWAVPWGYVLYLCRGAKIICLEVISRYFIGYVMGCMSWKYVWHICRGVMHP